MAELWSSLAVVAAVVLLCEAARRAAARLVPQDYRTYALEAASTFQLCACTHELKLLAEVGGVDPGVGLTLTYFMTVVHVSTFRGASCNPSAALEAWYRGSGSAGGAALCQFAAAIAARKSAAFLWTLGLSELHARHGKFDYKCYDPIHGTLLEAASVELSCAFAVQAAVTNLHQLHPRLRVHAAAALVTALVFAGGSVSGAVFNPALALSIQFPCSGHSYLEYCLVYWLGPALGVMSCILLFDKVIPFLSGKISVGADALVARTKKTE